MNEEDRQKEIIHRDLHRMFDNLETLFNNVYNKVYHGRDINNNKLTDTEKKWIKKYQEEFHNKAKNVYSKLIKHKLMEVVTALGDDKRKHDWTDKDKFITNVRKFKIIRKRLERDLL